MKQMSLVDNDGFEIEVILVKEPSDLMEGEEIPNIPPNAVPANEGNPKGLFQPKWDFINKEWVEGLSKQEANKKRLEIEEQEKQENLKDKAERLEKDLKETQRVLNFILFG